MHYSINNLLRIKDEIYSKSNEKNVKIIAVTKTFDRKKIDPLIDYGHLHFGENKVQEALRKWPEILIKNKNINLHMIGKLQTNKVKYAVNLFNYIHSVDNLKLAKKISDEQKKINKNIKIFIQVNIDNESQKNGIKEEELQEFYNTLKNELNLDVVGLMCIPSEKNEPRESFNRMQKLNAKISTNELSMGMSSDYIDAIEFGATFVRIGSKIFGSRF
jgi:pyridoxal phosphate enzyme (YggS family)